VAFVFFQVILGETLQLPDWVDGISPFWHLPGLPVENFNSRPRSPSSSWRRRWCCWACGATSAATLARASFPRR
jgi:hypothetical protein